MEEQQRELDEQEIREVSAVHRLWYGTPVLLGFLILLGPLSDQAHSKESKVVTSGAPTSAADRVQSWQRHLELREASGFKSLRWRAVGPRMQGGRIESIASPSGNTSVMYVGVGSGNLWKTINNGITWTPIFEHEASTRM